jgi:hypothetical protein
MKLIIVLMMFVQSISYNVGYSAGIEHAVYTAQPDFEAHTITFDGTIYSYE